MSHPVRVFVGVAILPAYFIATLLIGWLTHRRSDSSNAFLNASRSLPLPVVTAAYLAANCGALEIVGLSAMAAQYGALAFHFYWIGAIPAMIFLAIWMMPVYRHSQLRSIPEYLERRYGSGIRLLNACILAIMMLLFAGISLYAMAQVLQVVIGLHFATSIFLSASVVLVYVLLGGVRATIYNEVFQLSVMVAGLLPLAIRSTRHGALSALPPAHAHLWLSIPLASRAAPLDVFGIVIGLGFVLSFGYWCTDFVLMQRAFTARTDDDARKVPLLAGFGKIGFSLLVVLPGLAASTLIPGLGHAERFDQALPALMRLLYGPVMLGVGLTALAASLMSGLAANISAFAALWTEDIYHAHLVRSRPDRHYLRMGRAATIAAIAISTLTSYINFLFSDLMEHVQLIFSVFGAPFFAIFLLGMATRRVNQRGAIAGFLAGAGAALLHLVALSLGWIHYGSMMTANFYVASFAFSTSAVVALAASSFGKTQPPDRSSNVLQMSFSAKGTRPLLWILSALLLAACVSLNILWR